MVEAENLTKILENEREAKSLMCEAVAKYFGISSVEDLVVRMPYIIAHDFQVKKRDKSRVYQVKPSDTVREVYNALPRLSDGSIDQSGMDIFSCEFGKIWNNHLKNMDFDKVFELFKYKPIILSCPQQAKFASDMINYYLRYKDKNGDKTAKVLLVGKKIGNISVKHFLVYYNTRLLETSNNIKPRNDDGIIVDVMNLPLDISKKESFVREEDITYKGDSLLKIAWNGETPPKSLEEIPEYDIDADWMKWCKK